MLQLVDSIYPLYTEGLGSISIPTDVFYGFLSLFRHILGWYHKQSLNFCILPNSSFIIILPFDIYNLCS